MGRRNGSTRTAGGLSKKEPFFNVFNRARCRCTDPNNKDYSRYGGRGIKCEWTNYLSFKKDMYASYLKHKKKYPKNTTLERIDNNGNYSKENCRWATFQEQAKNKRTNRYITYKGETLIIADWAKKLGVHRQTLRYRLESGWPPELVLTTEIKHSNKYDRKNKVVSSSKKIS